MVLFNASIFGFKLYQLFGLPICLSTAKVAIGETAVMIICYILFMLIKCRKPLFNSIRANQNIEFKC